jgi:hypothetical protein
VTERFQPTGAAGSSQGLGTEMTSLEEVSCTSSRAVQTTLDPSGPEVELQGVSCVSAAACTAVGLYDTTTSEESRRTLAEVFG